MSLIIKISAMTVLTLLALSTAYGSNRMSSPSGDVRIIEISDGSKIIAVGNQLLDLDDAYLVSLKERLGNLILVQISSGGSACPALYAWLNTTPGSVDITDTFGTCSDIYELSHDSETVALSMASMVPSEGRVAFVYDGETVSEQMLGLSESAASRAGNNDPDAWIGESPYTYLTAKDKEAELIALMGWDTLNTLRESIVVGSQDMFVENEWIVGKDCRPHACNTDQAAIAIHRVSGKMIAVLMQEGESAQLIGQPMSSLPNTLRKMITSR